MDSSPNMVAEGGRALLACLGGRREAGRKACISPATYRREKARLTAWAT